MKLSDKATEILGDYFEDTPPGVIAASILEDLGAKAARQFFGIFLRNKQQEAKTYGLMGEDKEYYDSEIRKLKEIIAEIDRQA